MALFYNDTITFPIFGTVVRTYADDEVTYATATRTPWNLTAAYQAEGGTNPTKTFRVSGFSKLNLDILYTMGAAETSNSIEIKIECSPDGLNFYRIPNESVSSGVSTLDKREFTFVGANAAADTISIGLDIFYKYLKVSAKETGVAAAFGTVYCEASLAGI